MPELRQVRYFVAVAEEGQMTRAANRLHIAQPALSQAIAQLEARLGVELFARHARGMTLTPAGEAFLEKARTALTALDDADNAARTRGRATGGKLEWGFIAVPPMIQAPDLYSLFVAAHPEAESAFRELQWPRGTTSLWLEQVDLGLCFSPTPHAEVCLQPLRSEPRVVVAAKDHPLAERSELTVAEVLDETFCGEDPALEQVRAGFWRLDDHRGGPPRRTADRASNPQELLAAVACGRGIATAPASSARVMLATAPSVVTIPLTDADPTVLSLVWHRENRNPLVDVAASLAASIANVGETGDAEPAVAAR
jgi:DNA-binding transcriptional LysR family regulator